MFYLNEYETDRRYGGPEEGGWWYFTGKFIKCHDYFLTSESAETARDAPAQLCRKKKTRVCIRLLASLCEGEWIVLNIEDHEGQNYPSERPYYE